MNNKGNEIYQYSEKEILDMLDETSQLIAQQQIEQLSSAAVAAQGSNVLTNNVEFWQWMSRNYSNANIFQSNEAMMQYISKGATKEAWMAKQIQGKGYEWDWMHAQRADIKNIFNRYDAGDVVNRAASDVTETNIFSGKSTEYQMKAYTSKTNPDLSNTPKDMTVVTNAEKVNTVRSNGYENVEEFQDASKIKQATQERMDQIKSGKAQTTYNLKNVTGTMAKAGVIGCAIGIGVEAICSYKAWKQGQLSNEEYLKEILKAGGDSGVTAGATAGVMIPVSAAITAVGASTILTIPIAFIIGGAVNKVVAPCFGRGEYRNILSKAKYYQSIENVYDDLVNSMQNAAKSYYQYVFLINKQHAIHNELKRCSKEMDKDLKDLYDSI